MSSDDAPSPSEPQAPPQPPVPPQQPVAPAPPPPPPGYGPQPAAQPHAAQPQPQTPQPQAPQPQPQPTPPYAGQAYAGQPQPTPPYAGQAYAGQPQATPPYPGQPAQAHPGQPQPTPPYPGQPYPGQPYGVVGGQPPARKGLGVGAIIAIIGGGLALLVVVAIVVAVLLGRGVAGAPGAGPAPATGDPSAVVTAYLEALAASDAEAALALLDDRPQDESLLTDEMLEASNELAPLTDIEVEAVDGSSFSSNVPATYSLGDVAVATDFSLYQDDDGAWKIGAGVNELSLGGQYAGLALTLNGVEVEGENPTVFPGTYVLGTSTPYFQITGETTFTVEDAYSYPDLEASATLNEEGLGVFRTAINAAVTACVAAKTLTADCGLTLPPTLDDGTVLVDGTVTRTPRADTQSELANLQPEESYGEPLQVRSQFIGGLDTTAECDQGGSRGTCTLIFAPTLGSALVDFAQDPVVVRWD